MTPVELQEQAEFLRGPIVEDALGRGLALDTLSLDAGDGRGYAATESDPPGSVASVNCCRKTWNC